MHWRKAPSESNGKLFYIVVVALSASVALTAVLLVLHRHA
jgi:hypothetical protein